jgi:hypothetical protein
MGYQTTLQNQNHLRTGSAKLEVSDDGLSFVNLGVLNKPSFADKLNPTPIHSGNGGTIEVLSKEPECEVSAESLEIDLTFLNLIRGGIDSYSTTAGTPVPVTAEAHGTGWTQGRPFGLTYKNGDNTVVASITVKGGGSSLILNTDYRIYVGDGTNGVLGVTYVTPITSQAGAITVDYTYTPNQNKILSSGGNKTIAFRYIRLTNTNASNKKFQIDVYRAFNDEGIKFDFPDDDDAKVMVYGVKFKGTKDPTRVAGDQLFKITCEQSVA